MNKRQTDRKTDKEHKIPDRRQTDRETYKQRHKQTDSKQRQTAKFLTPSHLGNKILRSVLAKRNSILCSFLL